MINDLYANYTPVTNMDVYTSTATASSRYDEFTRALDSLRNVSDTITANLGNAVNDGLLCYASDNIRGRRAQYVNVTFDESMRDSSMWTITIPSIEDKNEEYAEVYPIAEEDLRETLNI